jgi:hypothetical protein
MNLLVLALVVPIVVASRMGKGREALVRADERGLHVDGQLVLAHEAIERGAYNPSKQRLELFGNRGQHVHVAVTGTEEARSILSILGESATQAVFEARANPPSTQILAAVGLIAGFVGFVAAKGIASLPMKLAAVAALTGVLAAAAQRVRGQLVRVGADGVAVRWAGSERFVRYGDLERTERTERGLNLVLRGGETVHLDFKRKHGVAPERDIVAERIAEASAAHASGAPVDPSALLLRGGRPADQWLAALRGLGLGDVDYRRAAPDRDQLLRIAEDPARPEEERAAAAVAVGTSLRDGDADRLRRVAAASASPKLRVAVDAALGDDDGRMVAALESMSEDETAQALGVVEKRDAR